MIPRSKVDPTAVALVGREFGRSALHAAAGSGCAQVIQLTELCLPPLKTKP